MPKLALNGKSGCVFYTTIKIVHARITRNYEAALLSFMGVPALWIPAYAGMTVMRCRIDGDALSCRYSHGGAPHVIADLIRNPEVRWTDRQQSKTTNRIPSPLMGEESKVRVKQAKTTNRIPSPLIKNFAKLSRTAIMCHDS